MGIKQQIVIRSTVLKSHVNKYALLGLVISVGSIVFATLLVCYQMVNAITIQGIIEAQRTNPAIWALDLTPFMFAYWGQSFCYELASKAESLLEETTRELEIKSGDLKLKLQYETNHDYLTNLPNHRLLAQRIDQGIKQIQPEEELALILISIDNFKEINYNIGSFRANSLLLQFTEKLKTLLLEPFLLQAYMGMNMIARLQSAEFAILIPRLRKEHNFESILTNLLQSTAMGMMIDGNNISITTTVGIIFAPVHGENADILIQRANIALLRAEKKKQRFAVYDPSMDIEFKESHTALQDLTQAVEKEEIEVLYQPELELDTEHVIGAEVLIDHENPNNERLSSDKILELVEGSNLIKPITSFVLNKAIAQLAALHQENKKIYLTVNIFDATDPELPSYIDSLLKSHHVSAEYLKIAITEKSCLSDQTHSQTVLNHLAELGIKIVISDFCSGYSSFVYLTNFPISEIKIDKSIISNMGTDEKKKRIVNAIIKMADAFHVRVFAEGITDQSILEELKQMNCKYGQGSYFSPELKGEGLMARAPTHQI